MIILVTGASRGLGLALTGECLGRGHTVIAACREQSDTLASLREKYPKSLSVEIMDVAREDSVRDAFERVSASFAYVDVIINNAAVLLESKYFAGDPITEASLANWETTLNVNVMGPARVLHYFMNLLYHSEIPFILNISSEGAMLKPAGSHYPAYSMSKYALNMYTQKMYNYLKEQHPDFHARVYMVHPGRMNTVMGVENAQIEPEIPARGICDILEGITAVPEMVIPFIDYTGAPMPDHYEGVGK